MRIIAGTFKGRRLVGPTGAGVRPTSDRLRETLFNVIGARVTGSRVLDGFAGTGAVGLEALSRGAAHATFVERDSRAIRDIEQNVATCGVRSACAIIRGDFLGLHARQPMLGSFDLAVLDPPYQAADLEAVVAEGAAALAPGGLLVLEYSRRRDPPAAAGGVLRHRILTAGDSALAFYAAGAPRG
jgi:16S rRNA (guanine966-N2)-methyltransferase